jgi:hypothetical protein
MFFFEKKNQKTFVGAVADLSREPTTGIESFLLLFFKKEESSRVVATRARPPV